jgi:hypothetical protein
MPTRLRLFLVLLFALFVGALAGAQHKSPVLGYAVATAVAATYLAAQRGLLLGANSQVGRQLRTSRPPTFANYTVRGGTWQENDATKTEAQMNGDEETFNLTGWDPGIDAKAELFPDAGYELYVLDVLTETGVDAPRSFVVQSITKKNFGKRALIYEVSLIQRTALDTTQVS